MRVQLLAGVAALSLLTGCTTTTTSQTISLAAVQAEGNAILAALKAGATVYTTASSTTPEEALAVEHVLAIAEAENAVLQGNLPTGTPAQMVESMGQDITAVLAVMPIDPMTKVAIDAGLAIIDTFIAQQMVLPASIPALKLAPRVLVAPVLPPVPIPAPHVLPPL